MRLSSPTVTGNIYSIYFCKRHILLVTRLSRRLESSLATFSDRFTENPRWPAPGKYNGTNAS
jgi:hypothetical protein